MIVSATLNGINDLANDVVLMVFLALFTVISLLVCVWIIAASSRKPDSPIIGKMKAVGVVWIVVVIGFVVRIAFSLLTVGYLGTNSINPMTNTDGLMGMYGYLWDTLRLGFVEGSYYPVHNYIQLLFAKILEVFGGLDAGGNTIMRLIFRLPYMLCDAAAAVIMFKIGKKYSNTQTAVALAALYSLCPIFFFASGIWGSATSMISLLILLSLYFMTQKKILFVSITYALALLTAPEAVYFLPVFGVFYAFSLIKAVKAFKNAPDSRALGIKKLFLDEERGLIMRIPLYLVGSLVAMYLITLPMLKHLGYNFFKWFSFIYVQPFTTTKYFSNNAFSIYNIFGRNNAELGSSTPVWLISVGFLLIAAALITVLYVSKKNRANMVIIAAYSVVTMGVYAMGFSALTMLPVLSALLLAFVLIKDKRILHVFGLLSLIMIINASAVMASAGYFSTTKIVDYALSTGTTMLSKTTFGQVISIICAVFAMLTHLYFTLVVLDISMAGRRVLLNAKNDSFGAAMKSWLGKNQ